jgi:hypothetical protein
MKVSKNGLRELAVMYVSTLDVSRENCHLAGDIDLFQAQDRVFAETFVLQT